MQSLIPLHILRIQRVNIFLPLAQTIKDFSTDHGDLAAQTKFEGTGERKKAAK
jgi:hypothetical protein